ncbi:MAG: MFS transporter [Deltaproteobacteria bacterium]|nr:MFS transporter [Deltaproteobacteria bacterium]MBW1817354.1 MFS transporter [Deltaproteobacteria bacterium]
MKKRPYIFYGWYIVAAGIVSYALGYGARYSFSVIFPSLLEEFHWPRDLTAGMLSVHLFVYGLTAPLAGHLADRVGPRKTMGVGALVLCLGLAVSGMGNRLWHFYLTFGVLTGAGLCLIGAVPFTTIIRNWFEKKRGLAFSILFFGAGAAYVCYPGIAFLITHVGWRITFLTESLVIAAAVPIVLFIIKYHPREKGLAVDGIRENLKDDSIEEAAPEMVDRIWAATDWTVTTAIKRARFWMLCLTTFSLWGISQHIMVTHHVAFAIDCGYSRIYASSVLSIFGITFGLGCLAAMVSDRIGRELTFTIGGVISVSGITILTFMDDTSQPWMLYYYAVAFGIGLGMATPTIPAAVTDVFQGPKAGAIIGLIWFAFALGGTIGPWLGGWLFEVRANYDLAFGVAIMSVIVSCAAMWLASPGKVRPVPGPKRKALKKQDID